MKCIHLEKGPEQEHADIIRPTTQEVVATLCTKQCFPVFQNDPRNNPAESEAYNIYYSLDPDLPKDQWTKANDCPIPRTPSGRVNYRIPGSTMITGADYYFYIITINALGFESYPSEVTKGLGSDDIDLPVF